MVWSCEMSGRSRESRPSASGGQASKKNLSSHNQRTAHKPKASAEAIQMARILEDSSKTIELDTQVTSVLTVVPGCTEEQVHLALHDNNYDLDKTISALLDSDGVANQGEWTTTTSSRKARKKGLNTEEHKKASTGRPNGRSAASGGRESYGGSVTVSGGSGSGNRMGQRQALGRGRGQSTGKRLRSGPNMNEQRRTRTRDKDKSYGTTAPKTSSEVWDSLPTATEQKEISSEDWGSEGDLLQQQATLSVQTSKFWELPAETGLQQRQSRDTSLERDIGIEQSRDVTVEQPELNELDDEVDFVEEEFIDEVVEEKIEPQSVFPEAIPGGPVLLQHSTRSETTPTTLVNTEGVREGGYTMTTIPSESREKVISRKPKRLARSQIPTKPVEMPAGIESLDVQFGELGIDFVGLESRSPPSLEKASEGSISCAPVSATTPTPTDPISSADSAVQGLSYSQLQQRYEESSASVSMSTPSSSGGAGGIGGDGGRALLQLPVERSSYSEKGMTSDDMSSSSGGGGNLRSPPGLPHPVANTTVVVSASSGSSASNDIQYGGSSSAAGGVESTTASLTTRTPAPNDQATPMGGVGVGGASSSQKQGPSESQLHIRSEVSASQSLKPTSIDLPMEIATRKNQPATQTTSVPGSIQHPPFLSAASSGTDKFSTNVTGNVSVSSLSSSSRAVSASSSLTSQHHHQQQHHQTHQQQGKMSGSNVPPGIVYPHMMHAQYPFIPTVSPAAMYNYDPNDMSRYSSGSMAYFPTSTDPTLGGALPSRDPTSSAFQAQTDQAKYAPPRGVASELGSSVTASSNHQSQQQGGNLQQAAAAAAGGAQQMGPAFMGAPFYGSMFYPTMYGPMPAFSQAANFGVSYEDMLAASASHDYSKMYGGSGSSLSKQPSSTSTAPIDSSAALVPQASSSFKHLETNKSFNYSVPGGVGGTQAPTAAPGYYMQMPFPHMMVGPGADVGGVAGGVAPPHSRISQQKHSSKVGGGASYQGSGTSYWTSTAAHSS